MASSFRIYQYLFKRNNERISCQLYDNELVNQAIKNRADYLASRAVELYSIKIYYVILHEGFRHETSFLERISNFASAPRRAAGEIVSAFSTRAEVELIEAEVDDGIATLLHRANSFVGQLTDLCRLTLLHKNEAFRVLKHLLNFAPHKLDFAQRKHDAFLDYYLPDSTVECHRGHLLGPSFRSGHCGSAHVAVPLFSAVRLIRKWFLSERQS